MHLPTLLGEKTTYFKYYPSHTLVDNLMSYFEIWRLEDEGVGVVLILPFDISPIME